MGGVCVAASANGVQQLLKAVSMGATLVGGSSGQPALFTIAPGMPPQASSLVSLSASLPACMPRGPSRAGPWLPPAPVWPDGLPSA